MYGLVDWRFVAVVRAQGESGRIRFGWEGWSGCWCLVGDVGVVCVGVGWRLDEVGATTLT